MKKHKYDNVKTELLNKSYEELELRVLERTKELEKVNANLRKEIQRHELTQQVLRDTKARLSCIVKSAMDAIISINSNQKIILFNEAAEKMFMCKAEEVIGTSISRFIPDRFKKVHAQHISLFGNTGITNRSMSSLGAISGIRNNGVEFPIEASISQAEVSGKKIYTVILRDITKRKRTEESMEASLKEKTVLLKEIHHRVKNNMQVISSLLNLQSNYIRDKETLKVFKESQNRVRSMALIHEKLYLSGNLSSVNIKDYIKDLSEKLFTSYRHEAKNVSLKLNVDELFLEVDKCIAIGLILNELISNSLKHAFVNKTGGEIFISLRQLKDKILLTAEDNGIGLTENFNFRNTESLGLQLVVSLVDQHNGNIEYDGRSGTKFTISFQTS